MRLNIKLIYFLKSFGFILLVCDAFIINSIKPSIAIANDNFLSKSCPIFFKEPNVRPVRVKLETSENSPKIENILSQLKKKILGQPHLINALGDLLTRGELGITRRGTAGSFLVYGPTGVGKTLLFEELSKLIGGSLIQIEGGNFTQRGSITALTGASPTFVGHGSSSPIITQEIINKAQGTELPLTIILINELEKANGDFINWWLKTLDSGENEVWVPKTSDGSNGGAVLQKVSFKNVLFVATSNGAAQLVKEESNRIYKNHLGTNLIGIYGYGDIANTLVPNFSFAQRAYNELLNIFEKPEFLGRFDKIEPAYPLLTKGYEKIINLEIERVIHQIKDQIPSLKLKVRLTKNARLWLLDKINLDLGARNLSKIIDRYIEAPLLRAISNKKLINSSKIAVNAEPLDLEMSFYPKDDLKADAESIVRENKKIEIQPPVYKRAEVVEKILSEEDNIKYFNLIISLQNQNEIIISTEAIIAILDKMPLNTDVGWDVHNNYLPIIEIKKRGLGDFIQTDRKFADLHTLTQLLFKINNPLTRAEFIKLQELIKKIYSQSRNYTTRSDSYKVSIEKLFLEILLDLGLTGN